MFKKDSNRFFALSIALALLWTHTAGAEAWTDYRPAIVPGDAVSIRNRSAYATPFLSVPTLADLEIPMGIYFNGVQGYEIERGNGFVKIAIGGNGLDDGISGYVQEEHVVGGSEAASLPVVTLAGKNGNGQISLYLEYAEDAPVIASLPSGADAELLGYMGIWCHVRADEAHGFVKAEDVSFPSDVQQGIESALPPQFDDYTPQQKHAMDITVAFFHEMSDQYGERLGWPLEIKAQEAALSISLGRGQISDFGVDIMPGAGDLPREEALEIAKSALREQRLLTDEQLTEYDAAVSFIDYNWQYTGHHWRFEFILGDGIGSGTCRAYVVVSSPEGKVVEISGTNGEE